jgi:hypothetical protein
MIYRVIKDDALEREVYDSETSARKAVDGESKLYYNRGKTYMIVKVVAVNEPQRTWK